MKRRLEGAVALEVCADSREYGGFPVGGRLVQVIQAAFPLSAPEEVAGIADEDQPLPGARQCLHQCRRPFAVSNRAVSMAAREADHHDVGLSLPEVGGPADRDGTGLRG